MKEREEFEIYCYEADDGSICLEFGEAEVSFSKKRFLEFADKLNEVRQVVLREYLQQQQKANRLVTTGSYRI